MNYKSYYDLSLDIQKHLSILHKKQIDLVVGIPRSGMVPAYMIALMLNVDCTDLDSLVNDTPLKRGLSRKKVNRCNNINSPSDAQNILLVDDSIFTGKSLVQELSKIPDIYQDKITTLAIYSSRIDRNDIDLVFEYVPMPRVFEWNIYHHGILEDSCVDIDGVLCLDPTSLQNDDGEKYIEFLLNAEAKIVPSVRIHSLVTSRLEKYRSETEAWLKNNQIEYDNLIMLDLPSKEERQKSKSHAAHKGKYYKKSDTKFFIESDRSQAIEISKISNKAVFSVEDGLVYINGVLHPSITSVRDFSARNGITLKRYIIEKLKIKIRNLF